MSSDSDDTSEDDASAAVPERSLADRVYWGFLIVMQLVMAVELVFLLVETLWLNALLVACIMVADHGAGLCRASPSRANPGRVPIDDGGVRLRDALSR